MWRLKELAELVNGNIVGDPETEIEDIATVSRAGAGHITFVTQTKYLANFLSSGASSAIISNEMECNERPCIKVADPYAAFTKVVELIRPKAVSSRVGISPGAFVSPSAQIAEDVDIYPGAYIGENVSIGCGTTIFPNVTVMEGCKIGQNVKLYASATLYADTIVGDRSIVHSGVVLGAYGFGYQSTSEEHILSPQLGNVVVGVDVEIGSNSTVDRGTFESTTIGDGTKLDDQVMIGHNCQIGKHNLICSQVGIAGSCTTGDFVVMGGQVGITDHVNVGNRVFLHGKSGVMQDVPDGAAMLGGPAYPIRQEMQFIALKPKLPQMRKQIRRLEKQVGELMKQIKSSTSSAKSEAA